VESPTRGGSIRIYEETKQQYIIVDVKSEAVVINVSASPDKFDEFLPKAQKVLDTVEWKSG
jgi:acetolactate synthase small subunit